MENFSARQSELYQSDVERNGVENTARIDPINTNMDDIANNFQHTNLQQHAPENSFSTLKSHREHPRSIYVAKIDLSTSIEKKNGVNFGRDGSID